MATHEITPPTVEEGTLFPTQISIVVSIISLKIERYSNANQVDIYSCGLRLIGVIGQRCICQFVVIEAGVLDIYGFENFDNGTGCRYIEFWRNLECYCG